MKNLIKTSMIALVISSLFVVSCKKPGIGDIPAPPADNGTTTTWTPKGSEKPIVTSSDIKNGDVGVAYNIVPKVAVCGTCPGTWSLKVDAPVNAQYAAVYSAKNGSVAFTPLTAGTYTLTLTYKSACAPDLVIVIHITVS